jgi:tRNA G18 (ribose-2'-O)-methylase SpoU
LLKPALLLGAEGPGLSAAALQAADLRVRIPIDPAVDSLNVTVAAAIALAALTRPPSVKPA